MASLSSQDPGIRGGLSDPPPSSTTHWSPVRDGAFRPAGTARRGSPPLFCSETTGRPAPARNRIEDLTGYEGQKIAEAAPGGGLFEKVPDKIDPAADNILCPETK